MSKTFTGSLSNKRKADLVEIAEALNLPEAEGTVGTLIKSIQGHLEANETTLKDSPAFKGLYKGGRKSETEASPDIVATNATNALGSAVKRSRKSVNKAVDRVQELVDAANVPLPESPLSVTKVKHAAETQLVPAQNFGDELTTRFQKVSGEITKFGHAQILRYEVAVRHVRDYMSHPAHLVSTAVGIELLFLLVHVTQWYNHTIFWPPASTDKGTLANLIHNMYFWAPKLAYTIRLPELSSVFDTHTWAAMAWWFSTTVLPALAASSIVSFVPQKGIHRHNVPVTRYSVNHPPTPTIDPLSFAIFRLALLLWPLTNAAPSAMVDALEMSGNPHGRALAAGLVAVLVFADRLRG